MNISKLELIHKTYSNVVFINSDGAAFDADGLEVAIDEALLESKKTELQAAEPMRLLRLQRDQLLSATDWWCVSDRTATQEQLDYRQALRDLPANCIPAVDENGQLTGVEWPVKPA